MVMTSFLCCTAPVKHCRSVESLLKAIDNGERARLTVYSSDRRPYVRRTQRTVTLKLSQEEVTINRSTYELIADRLDVSYIA